MKDKMFRQAVENYGKELETEVYLLEDPSFDHSVVGITMDGKLVYDFDLMIEEMAYEDHIDPIEAQEFIEYNTLRAIPYMGSKAPIIINYSKENLLNIFGDMSVVKENADNTQKNTDNSCEELDELSSHDIS